MTVRVSVRARARVWVWVWVCGCVRSFRPIYTGTPSVKCPYCTAQFMPDYKGQLCNVCQLSEVCTRVRVSVCEREICLVYMRS